MSAWHVHPDLLAEYVAGRLDPARVLAVEAHVAGCGTCRTRVPADPRWLADSWTRVLDQVDAPARSRTERLLTRCGLPAHRARLIVATPGLRWSWLVATAAVLAFGVAAAYAWRDGAGPAATLFLLVAPVLPVLAVAGAYGAPVDRMHEITATTPAAGPTLVLWRAAAVVGASIGLGVVGAVLVHGPSWFAVAWLLPALLLCVGSLALATVMSLQHATAVLGGTWLLGIAVVTGVAAPGTVLPGPAVQRYAFGPTAQVGYLLAAFAAAAVLMVRRRRLDPGEPR
jgi:anti-sigma factor RsiW